MTTTPTTRATTIDIDGVPYMRASVGSPLIGLRRTH